MYDLLIETTVGDSVVIGNNNTLSYTVVSKGTRLGNLNDAYESTTFEDGSWAGNMNYFESATVGSGGQLAWSGMPQ